MAEPSDTKEEIVVVRRRNAATQAVWFLFTLIEILLAFRFFLRLMGANPLARFTDLLYSLSWPFVAPFAAVFGSTRVEGSVFEWTTLLAMIVYWVTAWAIVRLILLAEPRGDI